MKSASIDSSERSLQGAIRYVHQEPEAQRANEGKQTTPKWRNGTGTTRTDGEPGRFIIEPAKSASEASQYLSLSRSPALFAT